MVEGVESEKSGYSNHILFRIPFTSQFWTCAFPLILWSLDRGRGCYSACFTVSAMVFSGSIDFHQSSTPSKEWNQLLGEFQWCDTKTRAMKRKDKKHDKGSYESNDKRAVHTWNNISVKESWQHSMLSVGITSKLLLWKCYTERFDKGL